MLRDTERAWSRAQPEIRRQISLGKVALAHPGRRSAAGAA